MIQHLFQHLILKAFGAISKQFKIAAAKRRMDKYQRLMLDAEDVNGYVEWGELWYKAFIEWCALTESKNIIYNTYIRDKEDKE